MDFKYKFALDQKGEKVIVTDDTDWNSSTPRSDYNIIFGVVRYVKNQPWQVVPTAGDDETIVLGSGLDNSEKSSTSFQLSEDGHYYVRVAYAIDGSGGFDSTTDISMSGNQIRYWDDSSYQNISYNQLMTEDVSRNGVVTIRTGFNPSIDKILDRMLVRHYQTNTPVESRNFQEFLTGYSLLVGAQSSLRQEAFLDYDDKIKVLHKLSKRWR